MVYLSDLLAVAFQKKDEKQLSKGIDPGIRPHPQKIRITHKMIEDFQIELEISYGRGQAGAGRHTGLTDTLNHLIDSFG